MDMIIKNSDGYYILDYLGQPFHNNCVEGMPDETRREYLECTEKAKLFIEAEKEKWEEKGNKKLADRYSLLNDYFKNRLG